MRYLLLSLLAAGPAFAQGYAPPAVPVRTVQIGYPDGGVQVLRAEVTGPGSAPVDVTGSTVGLSESATATLRTPTPCTVGPTSRFNVPDGALTYMVTRNSDGGVYGFGRRTQLLVQNVDSKDALSCGIGFLDAGTTPSCGSPGWGSTLFSGGGSATYEVNELVEAWCLGCGGDAITEVTEALCVP